MNRHASAMVFCALSLLAIRLPAEISVPLQIDTVTTLQGSSKLAVGLYVGVGGGAPRLYQLDTGSGSFLPSYSNNLDNGVDQWWGADWDTTGTQASTVSFGGRTVSYDTVNASVAFYDGPTGNQLIQSQNRMKVAQSTSATNDGTGQPTDWQSRTEAGEPALLGKYYGNFGAGLHSHSTSQGLYPILAQLTNGTNNKIRGYAISLGNLNAPTNPTMTLYFDSDFSGGQNPVADFTLSTDLIQDGGQFPNTDYPTASEFPLAVQSFEVDGQTQATDAPYSAVPDTGGLSLELPNGSVFNGLHTDGVFHSGLDFLMTLEGSSGSGDFTLGFTTGSEQSIDEVEVINPASHYNLGLDLYNYYDIYFDAAGSTMRFRPTAVPEPSTIAALMGLAVLGIAAWRRRRR